MKFKTIFLISLFLLTITTTSLFAQAEPSATFQPSILVKMSILAGIALLPFFVMILTSFVKIIIVLSLFRNALGVQQTPPNQVLTGLALLLTIYVMFPTGVAMYNSSKDVVSNAPPAALFSDQSAQQIIAIVDAAKEPFKAFLQKNALVKHVKSFYQLAQRTFPDPYKNQLKPTDLIILMPAFLTTQLKAAFEIGVLIYLPFFVIDLVTSNILLAMGMMMLSPLTISLPIKLLLLVMIDGWTLLVQGLVMTFK
jgi:type III secretion protein R